MAQVINKNFKDWSAGRKYPFDEECDLTCTDGRRLPLSYFVDAVIYPALDGTFDITRIDAGGMVISSSNWEGEALFSRYQNGWMPITRRGSIVGSIVLNDNDYAYVLGLASVRPMTFRTGHLRFAPGVVRSFCKRTENLEEKPTFFGEQVETLDASLDSERFTVLQDDTVDLDLTVTAYTIHQPITHISVKGTTYALGKNGHFMIRTPIWCDDPFISTGDGIILHRRGA